MKIPMLSPEEIRERHVAMWGEEKVAANERDVLARFGKNAPAHVRARYADEAGR